MLPILLGKNLKNKNQNLIENRARFSLYLLLPFLRFVLAPESGSRRAFIMRIRIRNNFLLTIVFVVVYISTSSGSCFFFLLSEDRLSMMVQLYSPDIPTAWVLLLATVARWPKVLRNKSKGAIKNILWPGIFGGRTATSFGQKWLQRGFKIFCLAVSCFCLKKFCQKCILLKLNFLKIFLS